MKKGRGWPFSKSKKQIFNDEIELDKHAFPGSKVKVKGRKDEFVRNMAFGPLEEGFVPVKDKGLGYGPYVDPDTGDISPTPVRPLPGPITSEVAVRHRDLANAYDKTKEDYKKKFSNQRMNMLFR